MEHDLVSLKHSVHRTQSSRVIYGESYKIGSQITSVESGLRVIGTMPVTAALQGVVLQ